MPYDGPGIYRHYKGNTYQVIGKAREEATLEEVVIYTSHGGEWWTRPLKNFNEVVPNMPFPPDFVPRFTKMENPCTEIKW